MVDRGMINGRFQVFHLKHMEYLLAAKMRCKLLYIGITHPDISAYAATSANDLHGTLKRDNPMTYMERYEMIKEALLEFGVKREEFEIVPFPISCVDVLPQYLPEHVTHFMSICGPWDKEKCEILRNQGLDVEILWQRYGEERGITGKEIRDLIADDQEWRQYVPKSVAEYMESRKIDKRIRRLYYNFSIQ